MPSPPRRARFQIHLSTALILTVVAGIYLGANLRQISEQNYNLSGVQTELHVAEESDRVYLRIRSHGWPFEAYSTTELIDMLANNSPNEQQLFSGFRAKGLVANSLLALAILFAVWFLCEWLIRWRAARKGG